MTFSSGMLAYKALPTIISFATISTGIRSAMFLSAPRIQFTIPIPPYSDRPPAAEIVSVHPLTGSFSAPQMMAGRMMKVGRLEFRFFLNVLSAIDFVKV